MGMVHFHNKTYDPLQNGRKLYKGGTTVVNNPNPTTSPSTGEAIDAYIKGMPQMYQAQLDWAPKMAESTMSLAQQYLPQATALQQQLTQQYAPQEAAQQWALQEQYGPLYAAQQQELQRQYEPEAYAAKQELGNITSGDYMSTAPWMQAGSSTAGALGNIYNQDYLQNYSAQNAPGLDAARNRVIQSSRGAWADRGLAQSGMSAEDETKMVSEFEFPYALQQEQLTQQTLGQRQAAALAYGQQEIGTQESAYDRYLAEVGRRQNVGLSLAGRYNVAQTPSVQTPNVSIPSYTSPDVTSGYNIGNVMNYMQQGYGTESASARPLGYSTSSGGLFGSLFG